MVFARAATNEEHSMEDGGLNADLVFSLWYCTDPAFWDFLGLPIGMIYSMIRLQLQSANSSNLVILNF